MSAIASLVRLHRWQLDERRRELADLDQLAHTLRQEVERLGLEVRQGADERRHKLEQTLASIEHQITLVREALAEAYHEVKRYEIAAANRLLQQRRRLGRPPEHPSGDLVIQRHRLRNRR